MPIAFHPDSGGRVAVVSLATDPRFTADLDAVAQQNLPKPPAVVLDFSEVRHINSSNISKLLRLRKRLILEDGKLVLCGLGTQVAGVFQVTGLDRVFLFAGDLESAVALASG